MRPVREVTIDSVVPPDNMVDVVGAIGPRRDVDDRWIGSTDQVTGQMVLVGPGCISVQLAGGRALFTLQLFDSEPPWELEGWRSVVGGAEIFPGMRVACTVGRDRVDADVGLNLPEENVFFRVYVADALDERNERWLVRFWPVNDASVSTDDEGHRDLPAAEVTAATPLSGLAPVGRSADQFDLVWARLLSWLDVNAPTSLALVRLPAPVADLQAAQAAFDCPWPSDLIRLYETCDGTADASRWGLNLLPLTPVVPLDYMLSTRQVHLEVQQEFPPGPDDEPEDESITAETHGVWMWSPRYVPFAEDGAGDGFFIDLRDGPAYGSVGRWLHADNRTAAVWPSLTAALVEVADAVENGRDFDGWTPLVTDTGELDWEPSHHHR